MHFVYGNVVETLVDITYDKGLGSPYPSQIFGLFNVALLSHFMTKPYFVVGLLYFDGR